MNYPKLNSDGESQEDIFEYCVMADMGVNNRE